MVIASETLVSFFILFSSVVDFDKLQFSWCMFFLKLV